MFSACADVLRSSLSVLIDLTSFESCTWFLAYGTLGQRNVCSQLCSVTFSSVVLLHIFAFCSVLSSRSLVYINEILGFLLQNIYSSLFRTWKLHAYLSVTLLCIPGHGLVLT